jgi:hypothetical protein
MFIGVGNDASYVFVGWVVKRVLPVDVDVTVGVLVFVTMTVTLLTG